MKTKLYCLQNQAIDLLTDKVMLLF